MQRHVVKAFLILLMFGCIDDFKVPIQTDQSTLVVEGLITNEPPPYKVKLSYSGPYRSGKIVPDSLKVTEAEVILFDDSGNKTNLELLAPGVFQTVDSSFMGTIGRSYFILINLPDGRSYKSFPEKLESVPEIKKISYRFSENVADLSKVGYSVFVSFDDPGEVSNSYRWSSLSYSLRHSTGACCPYEMLPFPRCAVCYTDCWVLTQDLSANLLSDELINGREVKEHEVFFSPVFGKGPHLIEISQYSISKSAFEFWRNFEEQRTRTGSILDPLPATLVGNIVNTANEQEHALGYFGASAVVRKRIKTDPLQIRQDLLNLMQKVFIKDGDCRKAYPGSEYDYNKPEEWEK